MSIRTTIESKRAVWKGKKTEQELISLLTAHGWKARRGATVAQGIDAIAVKPNSLVFLEVKHASDDRLSVNIEHLLSFCEMFADWNAVSVKGVIAVKFPYHGWRFRCIWDNILGQRYHSQTISVRREDDSDWDPSVESSQEERK